MRNNGPVQSSERDPRHAPRGRRLLGSMLLALSAVLGAACGDDPETPGSAAAYATVITWLVDRDAAVDEQDPTVFVIPQGEGFAIGLQLQADIVKLLADVADVRFVDDRAEALDGEGRPLDGGRLLAVGPAAEDGARVHIQVDEVLEGDRTRSWRFTLRPRGGEWRIAGSPSSVPG